MPQQKLPEVIRGMPIVPIETSDGQQMARKRTTEKQGEDQDKKHLSGLGLPVQPLDDPSQSSEDTRC